MKTKHKEFKPFDKVIFRPKNESYMWICGLFSNYDGKGANIIGHKNVLSFDEYNILPYEGNEHLVGTTDAPEEDITENEYVLGLTHDELFHPYLKEPYLLGKVKRLLKLVDTEYFDFGLFNKPYAIRLSDFDPDDMEETAKHILCVKNGKVVRYKPE